MKSTSKGRRAFRIELECGHVRFYVAVPSLGDELFCTSCNKASVVGPVIALAYGAKVIDKENDFWSQRISERKYEAGCLHDKCVFTTTEGEYYRLVSKMHRHYVNMHTRFGTGIEITEGTRPIRERNRNAEPPF